MIGREKDKKKIEILNSLSIFSYFLCHRIFTAIIEFILVGVICADTNKDPDKSYYAA